MFVQQGLRTGGFLHSDKTVVALATGQPVLVHLTGEPVAAVETEIHGEGKPDWHADMAQPSSSWRK